jgi:O-Antigen ligase
MPEYVKSLIVILVITALVALTFRKLLIEIGLDATVFRSRMWGSCLSMAAIFVAGNFWIAMILIGLIGFFCNKKERNPIALFILLLMGLPWLESDVSGFGVLEHLITLNPSRTLALVILLPAAFKIYQAQQKAGTFVMSMLDWVVFLYFAFFLCLMLDAGTFTNALRRGIVYAALDVLLLYFVATRTLGDREKLYDLLATLLFVGVLHSLFAIFEVTRSWLLFASVADQLETFVQFNPYDYREDGSLRARAASFHSIVLGTSLSVMMILSTIMLKNTKLLWKLLIFSIFLAGILATVSRGPWVGAAVGILVRLLVTGKAAKGALPFLGCCLVGVVALMFSEFGEKLVAYLPFVGTASTDSVQYRQMLFDVAVRVILDNPVFGSYDFMLKLADMGMTQGQGFVDLVNTYVAISLSGGFTALILFSFIIGLPTVRVWKTRRLEGFQDPDATAVRAALLGTIACVATIIATASFITTVQTFFWLSIAASFAFSESKPTLFNSEVKL